MSIFKGNIFMTSGLTSGGVYQVILISFEYLGNIGKVIQIKKGNRNVSPLTYFHVSSSMFTYNRTDL